MAGFSTGLSIYKIAFELSPIILNGGILSGVFPGEMLPIMAITEGANFPFSILSGAQGLSLDKFFAHFQVLPGSSLIQQDIGRYPFANATIAANAVIKQPVTVSMLMICPIQNKLGWAEKLGIISGLKWLFDEHNMRGGTYTVLTPSYIYTNCVMRGMHDASSQLSKQVQNTYQLDFEKPLVTETDVQAVLNSVTSIIKSGAGAVSDVFGIGSSATNPVSSLLTTLAPATSGQTAAATSVAGSVVAAPSAPSLGSLSFGGPR